MLPLNRILLETDSPFLSPQAVRGTINEPAHTRFILDRLCELRHESREEIENTIYENSLRFYHIKFYFEYIKIEFFNDDRDHLLLIIFHQKVQ